MSDLDSLSHAELLRVIVSLQERVAALEEENRQLRARLSGGGNAPTSSAPSWVKANRAEREKKERKKRDRPAFRRRDPATEEQPHVPEVCPDCGRTLSGGWQV